MRTILLKCVIENERWLMRQELNKAVSMNFVVALLPTLTSLIKVIKALLQLKCPCFVQHHRGLSLKFAELCDGSIATLSSAHISLEHSSTIGDQVRPQETQPSVRPQHVRCHAV